MRRYSPVFLILFIFFSASLCADFEEVALIGLDDKNWEEFAVGLDNSVPSPGSPDLGDNHYYTAGNYPEPIGLVEVTEDWNSRFDVLLLNNEIRRVYFSTDGYDVTKARISVTLGMFVDFWDKGDQIGLGHREYVIRHNGVTVADGLKHELHTIFHVEFDGQSLPESGLNTIEIEMVGGGDGKQDLFGLYTFASLFDFVRIAIDKGALEDSDADGLPRHWEEKNWLSDSFEGDAMSDRDGDGLLAFEEYAKGTSEIYKDTDQDGLSDSEELFSDPLVFDSDGDSLSDAEEVEGPYPSDPLLVDSDEDGLLDPWEKLTGYDPSDENSKPPPFDGAIAINITSDQNELTRLDPLRPFGVVPQLNWNQTKFYSLETGKGSQEDILTPIPGKLVNAAGEELATTLSWSAPSVNLVANSTVSDHPIKRMLSAFLFGEAGASAILELNNIPFDNYDVIVYFGGDYFLMPLQDTLTLNDDPETARNFRPHDTIMAQLRFLEISNGWTTVPQVGNFARYYNVSGSSIRLEHSAKFGGSICGISAIQIIDRGSDFDEDGLPDGWELEHGFDYSRPGEASLDPDGDGLVNLEEYQRNSDPHNADTDGDLLSDFSETDTGVYVNSTDAGTNPRLADTDGDGLMDGLEVFPDFFASNPLLEDSDGDGLNDREEVENFHNPSGGEVNTFKAPFFNEDKTVLTWEIDRVQFLFDFRKTILSPDYQLAIQINTTDLTDFEQGNHGNFFLETSEGGLGAKFDFTHGLFSTEENPYGLTLQLLDYSDPQSTDYWELFGLTTLPVLQVSDRLRLRFTATKNGEVWDIAAELFNFDRNEIIASAQVNGAMAGPSVTDGTAVFGSERSREEGAIDLHNIHSDWFSARVLFAVEPLAEEESMAAYKDSDSDGLPDSWELENQYPVDTANDGNEDEDGDSLTSNEEWLLGLNPKSTDSDEDGISDKEEIRFGSNPLDAQSLPFQYSSVFSRNGWDFDSNGWIDVLEARTATMGLSPGGDEDRDGYGNALEMSIGSDPFDSNSIPKIFIARQNEEVVVRNPILPYSNLDFQQSLDLQNWETFEAVAADATNEFRLSLDSLPSLLFFQQPLQWSLAPDSTLDGDGDGVSAAAEELLGTSDNDPDDSRNQIAMDTDGNGQIDTQLSGDLYTLNALAGGGLGKSDQLSPEQAARFLMQSTFGPTLQSIDYLQEIGIDTWLDEQLYEIPPSFYAPHMQAMYFTVPPDTNRMIRRDIAPFPESFSEINFRTFWAKAALAGPDQLRQRVAFALSEILVISNLVVNGVAETYTDYYDLLIRHSFGNYYDLLWDVTFHPVMGIYLTHVGNQKAIPELGLYPDENYAREIMQLFTIGLWELNPDGTRKRDVQGEPIPTYDNGDVAELARIFTGFYFATGTWGYEEVNPQPMVLYANKHDFGRKELLKDLVVSAKAESVENAYADVREALTFLFEHPNTPPFISKKLIQFLVTDNPSPAYVNRVQQVFVDNGQGVRGDMAAVIKAILTDYEARDPLIPLEHEAYGLLREPLIRLIHLGRIFEMGKEPEFAFWSHDLANEIGQEPLRAPTVFNFFQPTHQPSGVLGKQGYVGPVFQITNSVTTIAVPNYFWRMLTSHFHQQEGTNPGLYLDYSRFIPLEKDPESLVDVLNLVLCAGRMPKSSRQLIVDGLQALSDETPGAMSQVAIYATITSPYSAVQQ